MKKKLNMTEMFKGYSDYSEDEYKNIWENSIIVVDSNILLNFYRYSEETRNNIFKILEKLKDRLWIPYQVGKEFFDGTWNYCETFKLIFDENNQLVSIDNLRFNDDIF